jgi:hypothetical protein
MYASTLVLAVPVVIGRFFIVQSPLWLMFRDRVEQAEAATERLLLRDPRYPKEVVLRRAQARDTRHADQREKAPWSALFQGTNLDRTILASVPWFLQDLGTYGIGIFTPPSLPPSSAPASRTRATSPNSFRATSWPPRVRRSSTCC